MNTFCPICEKETAVNKIIEDVEITIRDEAIWISRVYFRCPDCGQEFENLHPETDYMDAAYREFRRRKGWLQPEDIKAFREELGLTQKQFSDLLGIGIATLNRYENGSLQSESHEQLIRLFFDDPGLLISVLKRKPGLLVPEEKVKLMAQLDEIEKDKSILVKKAVEKFGSYPPDILSGEKAFDLEKLVHVFKFFCCDNKVFKTKLNKLLFYADFMHFREYGASITGIRYAHAPYGPVPDNFETWLVAFSKWMEEIDSEEVYFGENVGEIYTSQKPPDMNLFQPSEIKVLQTVKEKFQEFSSREIKDYSHQEIGYIKTKEGELISYKYAESLKI